MPPGAERGLQRERTALAWDRTGVSFLIVSALLVRVIGPPYLRLHQLPAAVGLLVGAVLLSGALGRRGSRPGDVEEDRLRVRPAAVRLVGAASLALCMASLLAVVSA